MTDAALGAVAGFLGFALVAWIAALIFRKEALGQGDWWLLGMNGAFLGWEALLPIITLASLQGAIVGLLLIAIGRSETGEVPEQDESAGKKEVAENTDASAAGAVNAVDEEEDWVPPKHAVPFGPFLALAALEQLFFGEQIRALYERLLVGLIA